LAKNRKSFPDVLPAVKAAGFFPVGLAALRPSLPD
jgi:hypothetical protein